MSEHSHDIQKEVRGYLLVFGGLLIFTILTVVSALFLHLPLAAAITLALVIATIKAAMVACFFMHLISEKQMIYTVLAFAVIFFFGLLLLPVAQHHNVLSGTEFLHEAPQKPIHSH